METRFMGIVRLLVGASLILALLAVVAADEVGAGGVSLTPALLQDDDDDDDDDDGGTGAPAGTSAPVSGGVERPAHVHAGTCSNLDPNPLYPLASVVSIGDDDNDDGDRAVEVSDSELTVPLDDLMAAPHAINVHQSVQEVDVYVACGEIVGPVVDNRLVIGLRSQSESGLAGVAVLDDDDDDGLVEITGYLVAGLAGSTAGNDDDGADDAGDDAAGDDDAGEDDG